MQQEAPAYLLVSSGLFKPPAWDASVATPRPPGILLYSVRAPAQLSPMISDPRKCRAHAY